jgi:hypothetical protein
MSQLCTPETDWPPHGRGRRGVGDDDEHAFGLTGDGVHAHVMVGNDLLLGG